MTQQDSDFAAFMKTLDSAIQKNTEGTLTSEQLPEYNFWEAFKENVDPNELAHQVLVNEGFVFVDD